MAAPPRQNLPSFVPPAETSDRRYANWITAAAARYPSPVLTAALVVDTIQLAAAIDRDHAWVVYQTLLNILTTAIRNRRSVRIEGFGTFKTRLMRSRYRVVTFVPEKKSWWGWWMPMPAYDATTLQPIGIWDGPDLLPFGHPDNPYASIAEVPFAPDWSWTIAEPLPGDPPPTPYPHPLRHRKPAAWDLNARRDADPATRRKVRADRYQRRVKTNKIVRESPKF